MSNTEIMTDHAEQIAKALVKSKSAGYDFTDPKLWASGTYNPFYVDNRNLQSLPEIRKVLRKGLASLIKKEVDFIYGIPNAGIAPATLLAMELNKPLLIKLNGLYYSIDLNYVKELIKNSSGEFVKRANMIAGTTPFGVICGIVAAEEYNLPFIFIRKEPKKHGLNKQIEGIIKPGASVALMDPVVKGFHRYTDIASDSILKANMHLVEVWEMTLRIEKEDEFLLGATIVVAEDLVSTGESMLNELSEITEAYTAKVIPISIFDYKLKSSIENFTKNNLNNTSVVNLIGLIDAFANLKKVPQSDLNRILDWYKDQPNWGDQNGFPAVKN